MIRDIPARTRNGPVLDVVVSEDQGLVGIDIKVSSSLHGYEQAVGFHNGHGNRQNSHQRLKEGRKEGMGESHAKSQQRGRTRLSVQGSRALRPYPLRIQWIASAVVCQAKPRLFRARPWRWSKAFLS